ncbi:hypothetical protein Vi05172_g12069 [Venturia inaequalis]|nr:hypothetical protein Vi05172_g12069 [Venturia inaequalis]
MNHQHGLVMMQQSSHLGLRQASPLPRLPHQNNDPENLGERRRNHDYQYPNCCLGSLVVFSIALAILAAVFMDPAPELSTPLQALQSRSLLDNHDLYHLQAHAKALRAPLSNFHMEANMPLYRFYIFSIQRRNKKILHGIDNVTLCVEELVNISAQETKNQVNLGDKFEQKIEECSKVVGTVASLAKHGVGAYEQAIIFIDHEFGNCEKITRNSEDHFFTQGQAQARGVDASKGWCPFLQHSRIQWTSDKILLLSKLRRLSRFGIALQAMRPKRIEDLTPELIWEEVNDRAALCRSFGVVQGNGTVGSRWVLAADSEGGDVYLNWFNRVKMTGL